MRVVARQNAKGGNQFGKLEKVGIEAILCAHRDPTLFPHNCVAATCEPPSRCPMHERQVKHDGSILLLEADRGRSLKSTRMFIRLISRRPPAGVPELS